MFLSHPPIATKPSKPSQPITVSIESAMTSRDTNEYFIPSVPMEIPSEIVIENQFKIARPAILQGIQREPLHLRLETSATESSLNPAIRVEQSLGPDPLWTGTFHAGDDTQRDRFALKRGLGKSFKDQVHHNSKIIVEPGKDHVSNNGMIFMPWT